MIPVELLDGPLEGYHVSWGPDDIMEIEIKEGDFIAPDYYSAVLPPTVTYKRSGYSARYIGKDKNELDALRIENASLKEEITLLKKAIEPLLGMYIYIEPIEKATTETSPTLMEILKGWLKGSRNK